MFNWNCHDDSIKISITFCFCSSTFWSNESLKAFSVIIIQSSLLRLLSWRPIEFSNYLSYQMSVPSSEKTFVKQKIINYLGTLSVFDYQKIKITITIKKICILNSNIVS